MRVAWLAVLVALVALVAAAPAQGLSIERAQALATEEVGQPPCGQPTVRVVESLTVEGKPADGAAYYGECAIGITGTVAREAGSRLCRVMVHEYGHFVISAEHSTDPLSPLYVGPLSPPLPGACERERQRQVGHVVALWERSDRVVDRCHQLETNYWFSRRGSRAERRAGRRFRKCLRTMNRLDRWAGRERAVVELRGEGGWFGTG